VTKPPRFIAGAVCPSCRALDRIIVENDAGARSRRCVECGFVEREGDTAGSVPRGRHDRTQPVVPDTPSSAVRWVAPRAAKRVRKRERE
jgi:uncharacterized metal-binding protein (TIGR02443 family)